jgi:hypothetical protein
MCPVTNERPRGKESDGGGRNGSPLLGRFDAATLLAVEAANGGEWAALGQVVVTFNVVFGQLPDREEFTESCQLLCEAGLIEYVGEGLGLTPDGRRLLRRAGSRKERPKNVAELLGEIDELDLAAQGSVPEPDDIAVAAAFEALTPEVVDGFVFAQEMNATRLAPPNRWF